MSKFKLRSAVVVYPQLFTPSECKAIIDIFKSDESKIIDEMKGDEGKKLTFIELYKTPCVDWIYKKLTDAVNAANKTNFKFDMPISKSVVENIYINKYDAGEDSFRGWHVDGFLSDNPAYMTRKLTIVVQLSDTNDYTGADLQFVEYHNPKVDVKQQGSAVVFPSFEWHKISKVDTGVRYSMVLFLHGTPFR